MELESDNIAIGCISDARYLRYLKTLLQSLQDSNNELDVHVCLINIRFKKIVSSSLLAIYQNIHISYLDKKFVKSHFKKAFCANHRAELLLSLLKHNYDGVIYMDVDSIVRKKLNIQELNFKNCDVRILFRSGSEEKFKVAAGIICVTKSIASIKFIQAWRDALDQRKLEWFADQITFFQSYKIFSDQAIFANLDKKFIDWEFNESSAIWVGKGERKFRNILYRLETLNLKFKNLYIKEKISLFQAWIRERNQY